MRQCLALEIPDVQPAFYSFQSAIFRNQQWVGEAAISPSTQWHPLATFFLSVPHPMPAHLHPSAAAADRSIMWALTALLLLVPSSGQAATLEKPILSLHPPWTTIFKGERVTLKCDGYHPLLLELRPISTLWYLGHLLLPSHKKSIEVQTPGVYRCQTRGAPVSDPIHLSVSNDWLILQVPYTPVFEGEPLVLRCRGWYDKVIYKLHYYHDGQAVRYFHSSANYTVLQARASDSGRYQCSGTMRIPVESAPMFSAKVAVTVQAARCAASTGAPSTQSRSPRSRSWNRTGARRPPPPAVSGNAVRGCSSRDRVLPWTRPPPPPHEPQPWLLETSRFSSESPRCPDRSHRSPPSRAPLPPVCSSRRAAPRLLGHLPALRRRPWNNRLEP
ncbi:Fc receptor-like B isoform X3 [Piliocolobus tephrosceles]|uniref:Fc receptor-like B isoform X3 n=1 Tax=Piliocolobus tephrosceles TaxID=591936 RepID=UPI000C2A2BE5|nr:Fc receptor-like B isoform X3 [Piliocolobus tephrosceles]